MPTRYTAKLHDGEQSFQEFALDCARAFGALISLRDAPQGTEIPDVIEPSDYALRRVNKAKDELERALAMSDEEAEARAAEQYAEERDRWSKREADKRAIRQRYVGVLQQVEAWEPPTPDHEKYKEFMVQQLMDSIRYDCEPYNPPSPLSGKVYRQAQIDQARNDIEYYTEKHREEVERAASRTQWIQALKESLT